MKAFLWFSLAVWGLLVCTGCQPRLSGELVTVPGGTFRMGPPEGSKDLGADNPPHEVTVKPFRIGVAEVTQAQWKAVMGKNPSMFQGDSRPVEMITWYDAVAFCNRLSEKEGLTPAYTIQGQTVTWNRASPGYRLPTEAEWEYAARGGATGHGTRFAGSDNLDEVGWYTGNAYDMGEKKPGYGTHPVKSLKPNELGLYDMAGNVWDLCWDVYGNIDMNDKVDPAGPPSGDYRIARGGSWSVTMDRHPVWTRDAGPATAVTPEGGFRLAVNVTP